MMTEDNQFQMICPKCKSNSFTVRRDQRAYVHKSQPFELVFSCRCGKQLFGDQIQEEYDRQKAAWDKNPPEITPEDAEKLERKREEERRKEQLRRAMEYRRTYLIEKRLAQAEEERRRKEEEDRLWRDKVAEVEAEERGHGTSAAASAANGAKPSRSKVRKTKAPPATRLVPASSRPKPPPAVAPPKPKPVAPVAPPVAAPKPVAPTPKLASADDVDPEHPHAEFMPYLLRGQFSALFPDATPPDVKSPLLCVWPPCEKSRRKKSKYCSRECSNKNARWRHKMRKKEG